MEFREHLQIPNCPPEDALPPTSIMVYYLVKNNPPDASDFLSLRERRPNEEKFSPDSEECKACGVSVFTELDGIELARKVSRALRKMKTAKGELTSDLGIIKKTPSKNTGNSHCTWWIFKNAKPYNVFTVFIESE
jgi:hypothetical protein